MLGHPFGLPQTLRMTSPFGPRINPVTGEFQSQHAGIDLAVPQGTPLYAMADGEVVKVRRCGVWDGKNHPGGSSVSIWYPDHRVSSVFAHMSRIDVEKGQRVKAGEFVGLSGGAKGSPGAGRSTGPHLHLGIFTPPPEGQRRYVAVDPMTLIDWQHYEVIT